MNAVPCSMNTVRMQVQVPPGVKPGEFFQFRTIDGKMFRTTVPPGLRTGATFIVDVPVAPFMPVARPLSAQTTCAPPRAYTAPNTCTCPDVPMGLAVRNDSSTSMMEMRRWLPPTLPPAATELPAERAPAPPVASRPVALRHAECPICFEPLHKAPIGEEIVGKDAGQPYSAHTM